MTIQELNSELDEILTSLEFEEDGGIYITGTDWYQDDLKLEIAVNSGLDEGSQLWEAQVTGVREELIKSTWADDLRLLNDHVLLWPYNGTVSELYFSSPTEKPHELYVAVVEAHQRAVNNWIPLDRFINIKPYLPLLKLCKSTNALFAKGPTELLEIYAKVLSDFNMKPNIFGERTPKRWINKQFEEEAGNLKVLFVGESYIVAEDFDFIRV